MNVIVVDLCQLLAIQIMNCSWPLSISGSQPPGCSQSYFTFPSPLKIALRRMVPCCVFGVGGRVQISLWKLWGPNHYHSPSRKAGGPMWGQSLGQLGLLVDSGVKALVEALASRVAAAVWVPDACAVTLAVVLATQSFQVLQPWSGVKQAVTALGPRYLSSVLTSSWRKSMCLLLATGDLVTSV